jgi:predicted nucleic acid-binding protein
VVERRGHLGQSVLRVFPEPVVLVAAFTTRGLCADALRTVLARHRLLTSKGVLREVRRWLVEEFGAPVTIADQVIPFLREHGEVYDLKRPALPSARDDEAARLHAAAVEARADLVIAVTPALLTLARAASFPIVTPRGFWQLLRTPGEHQRAAGGTDPPAMKPRPSV